MDAEDIAKLYGVVARNAPAGEIAPECLFRMGELYAGEHSKRYDLALEPFETITARHPRSVFAPAAAFGAARARVLLSRKYPRDEKRTRAALQSIDAVLAGFAQRLPDPDEAVRTLQAWREEVSGRLSHAVFQQAEFYDTIRRKPEAAISAYRRFLELHPDAPDAEKARRRLAELESSSHSPNLSPSTAP
jgi:outer membrane protein assembly factor BamD (BamD/ComL family)